MQDVYWLGCCPAEEDAIQVGDADYASKAKAQCKRYIEAIRKVCGAEPEGARLTIKSQNHEFGVYYEVAVVFDGNNEAAAAYAARCDDSAPTTWEAAESVANEKIRFQPGTIVATIGALQVATHEQIAGILARHLAGDWGDVDKEDARANERALKEGERLLSSYEIAPDTKLWIVTEWDRSATTVLTPDEY